MHSTCKDSTTKAARRYVSPRNRPLTRREAEIRALAYAIKTTDCDPALVGAAARDMAALVEDDCGYLVPVPNHDGSTAANLRLAESIRDMSARRFEVADILMRPKAIESQCERHRRNLGATPPGEHGVSRLSPHHGVRLDGRKKVYFVDNVITSGNTIEACRHAFFGIGTGLVYADAHYDAKN